MNRRDIKLKRRLRRKMHIRRVIKGTPDKPRMTVYRSLNEIYAQIIDDVNGVTLVSASSIDKELKDKITANTKKMDKSKLVGELIAKRAIEKGIKAIKFDRNGYIFHGRVKALADSARESGLVF